MILNDTQVNGILNATEDLQIGDMSVSEKLDELNSNLAKLESNCIISSDEVKTRDTFFGKPVYTKSIRTNMQINAGESNPVSHGCLNVENIWIDLSNSYMQANNGLVFAVPIAYYGGGFDNIGLYINKENIYFSSQGTWNTNWLKNITVRYTKTTD